MTRVEGEELLLVVLLIALDIAGCLAVVSQGVLPVVSPDHLQTLHLSLERSRTIVFVAELS